MANETIDCVAFMLVKNNKMLVEKRKITKRVDPGKVCIPSGRIEEGETPEQAVKREIKEEFGVNIQKSSFVGSLIYPTSEVDFLVNYFVIKEWEGEIENLEAERIYWEDINEEVLDVWSDKIIIMTVKEQKLI